MKRNSLLVISPHPDDETLGAGGLILKYKDMGREVYWLNITNVKEEYGYSQDTVLMRNQELEEVNRLYDFDQSFNLELEPAGLDKYSSSDVIKRISTIINEIKPNVVVLPFRHDIHSDHYYVHNWVYSCTKSFRYPFITQILAMEIVSETDFASVEHGFVPNYFVDISRFLEKKLEIMRVYKTELHEEPFPRSINNIRSLATIRGATAGVQYAESFHMIKGIETDDWDE